MSKFHRLILPLATILLAACAPTSTGSLSPAETDALQPTQATVQATEPLPVIPPKTPVETELPPTPTSTELALITTPLPHLSAGQAITLTRVHMFTPSLGWGISGPDGGRDHILTTQDGGSTWTDVTPPEPAPEAGQVRRATAHFHDPQIAWVTYYSVEPGPVPASTQVWSTQDGGLTWQASQPLDTSGLVETYFPSHLQFVDPQNGWMLAHVGVGMNHDYVILFRTADGGKTWQRLLDPQNDGGIQACLKTAMLFVDARNGWLTGDCGGVAPGVLLFRTQDGGQSWQAVTLPAPAENPDLFGELSACGSYYPLFFTPLVGRLVVQCRLYTSDPPVSANFLYATPDGGETWGSLPYPGGALLAEDQQSLLALGMEIYRSSDGGQSWTQLATVTWEGDFTFVGDVGWAVARSQDAVALVKTTDRGASWSLLSPVIAP